MSQLAQKKTTNVVASELDKMLEADAGVGLEISLRKICRYLL